MSGDASQDEEHSEILILEPYVPFGAQLGIMRGSKVVTAGCGHKAWISPTGQFHIARTDRRVVTTCRHCSPGLDDPSVEKRVVAGAMEEFRQNMGTAIADQVAATLRDAGVNLDPHDTRRKS